jgi:DNA-binding response OmpR family regulator
MSGLNLDSRINLERAHVLLLDESLEGMGVLIKIVSAFGVRNIRHCRTIDEAKKEAGGAELDLALVGCGPESGSSYDFVKWLRRSGLGPNAFTPTILISGHTQFKNVQRARDCGANFIVAKPCSPGILLERIIWVAREKRPYIQCDSYFGPDRRVHDIGPPKGLPERRRAEEDEAEDVRAVGAAG